MKKLLSSVAVLGLASAASAGGLDRSGQGVGLIFEEGNVAQIGFANVTPSVSGTGNLTTAPTGEVANSYTSYSLGVKTDINDNLSFTLLLDQPFGADISYGTPSAASEYGGTFAVVKSTALTGILKYQASERMSVYGGLRYQTASGDIKLDGLVYASPTAGSIAGYRLELASDSGIGYLVGAAYEIPDIALRVALTYNSKIEHSLSSTETLPAAISPTGGVLTFPSSDVIVETPESLNLDFQSGIAKDTLLFGSIRYARWGDFDVVAPSLGADLADLGDSTSYSLGIGRRLNDTWSVSAVLGYEASGGGQVSPLAPTDGSKSLGLGAVYNADDYSITGGVRYVKAGDAVTTGGAGSFNDNDAVAVGFSIKFGL